MVNNPFSPSITIITAVFNGSPTITNCLNSVTSQSFSCEHLIIDGASTDNTIEIVQAINPQARIISESDNGIYDAMNKGIRNAGGEIIGILNADDFYASPNVLSSVAKVFEKRDIDACYGDLLYVAETPSSHPAEQQSISFKTVRYWKSGSFNSNKFYWGWMPPHPAFFVRRRMYDQYGQFNLGLGSAADYELMLRFLLKHKIRTAYIPEILVKMRTGGASNANLNNRVQANLMDRKAWDINGLKPYPWTLFFKPLRKIPQWFAKP